ncbi:MAG: acetate--CoA ligase family protein [Bacteroidota bacterium]
MTFTKETADRIDQIFQTAWDDGRQVLYEYEIYQILRSIGLDVPKFSFIPEPAEVTNELLEQFGRELVVKIVSPQIAHKQKLGGVKRVENKDPLFIQFVLERMRNEVLSHFPSGQQPEIKGFLIVEYIAHTQALGFETLLGIKEDPAFGPVLTLSKGGDDAEFFAKYYDPANLFLPPLTKASAYAMVNTLNIRHKYLQIGHPEYLEISARAIAEFSSLAYRYSFVAPNPPPFIIKSLDINPVVFSSDGRYLAIDGFGEFVPNQANAYHLNRLNPENINQFFTPQGIAVIGVSADWNKYSLGREIACILHDLGRTDLYFINSKGGTIRFGDTEYPLYRSIKELPFPVELVVYAAPAQHTLDFFRELPHAQSPKAIILISGIPAEINYSEYTKELQTVVPEGVRIIGPNCMGVFFAPDQNQPGLNTLFVEEHRLPIKSGPFSNTVLLTQSGAFSVTAIDKFQNARIFKAIVSFGNKYDVGISDLMNHFAKHPEVDLLALYLEGLAPGEGRQFFELASTINKPIVAYKAGRTEAGAKAAASHTASISGSYEVFKAACFQSGVVLAENINDFYDYIKIFALLARKLPQGNRVAGVVNAGFESTVGADELQNLHQAELSPETISRLNRINRHGLVDTASPFLDITPMADDRMYADFVEAVIQDENVDCVFVAIVPHAVSLKTTPDTCRDSDSLARLLVDLNRKYRKPMVISVNAGRYYQEFVAVMEEEGLPVYGDIRSAIKGLDRFVAFYSGKK